LSFFPSSNPSSGWATPFLSRALAFLSLSLILDSPQSAQSHNAILSFHPSCYPRPHFPWYPPPVPNLRQSHPFSPIKYRSMTHPCSCVLILVPISCSSSRAFPHIPCFYPKSNGRITFPISHSSCYIALRLPYLTVPLFSAAQCRTISSPFVWGAPVLA